MGNDINWVEAESLKESEELSECQFDFREMIQFKNRPIEDDYNLRAIKPKHRISSKMQRGVSKHGGMERAIKTIPKKQGDDQMVNSIVSEVQLKKNLDHPNICRLIDVYDSPKSYFMVMELLTGGRLLDRILQRKSLNETDISILRYLHSEKVMYRDLRPECLIFSDNGNNACLKIVDFESACTFQDSSLVERPMVGTSYYIAPEVLQKRYNQKCDLWSAGVILYIMLSGEPPFKGKDSTQVTNKVRSGIYSFDKPKWKVITSSAKDLVSKLLEIDPLKRISAAEAMKHSWFNTGKTRTGTQSILKDALNNLVNTKSVKKMQEGVLVFMVNFLTSQQERSMLMKAFKRIDCDGDGKISRDQLQLNFSKILNMKPQLARKKVVEVFSKVNKSRTGFIHYSQFLMFSINIEATLTDFRLQAAFRTLDMNGDGHLSLEELKKVLGPNIPTRIYAQLVRDFDQNRNGEISKSEFVVMMKSACSQLK